MPEHDSIARSGCVGTIRRLRYLKRSDLATRPQRRPNQRRPRNQKQRGKDNCKELPSGRKSAVLPNTTTFMDSDKTVQ
ncbi:hypothetical protein SNOG_08806 [Parastagonospora nodorum SN15]|uniref:Uncharacterized protein n=1 Tax=Phaeosphaeria nodorum (strain SN15 / ATCC MYA-4574 / FGSC 10173) TaxID=321614 RepID=Q0UHF8_PHANO|nr:hypothetical protein SNOG_08806 [Parastagonospora nodorum SN15]EAT83974.1 hypothetical protein SNOG_08806 [Parastagonospora nodorum SN15]